MRNFGFIEKAFDIVSVPSGADGGCPDGLSRHTMASRTPHALEFDETERGNIGPWSEIQNAVIP